MAQINEMMAMLELRLDGPALLHSDQGWQYQQRSYRLKLAELGIAQSMSRKATCLDNACMEGFFGHMKDEFYRGRRFESFEAFKAELEKYIDYWNTGRYQVRLKGMTPVQYRGSFHERRFRSLFDRPTFGVGVHRAALVEYADQAAHAKLVFRRPLGVIVGRVACKARTRDRAAGRLIAGIRGTDEAADFTGAGNLDARHRAISRDGIALAAEPDETANAVALEIPRKIIAGYGARRVHRALAQIRITIAEHTADLVVAGLTLTAPVTWQPSAAPVKTLPAITPT